MAGHLPGGQGICRCQHQLPADRRSKVPRANSRCQGRCPLAAGNAKKFNLDPDHFGAWGSSAGGHLAALLGTSGDVRVLEGPARTQFKTSSRIQAVVDWCGPSDVEKWTEFQASFAGLDADYPNQGVARLLGGPIENKRDLAQKANPITFISDKTPPFLIMHGDKDELVPLSQSELLEAALKKAGVPVELHVVRGSPPRDVQ